MIGRSKPAPPRRPRSARDRAASARSFGKSTRALRGHLDRFSRGQPDAAAIGELAAGAARRAVLVKPRLYVARSSVGAVIERRALSDQIAIYNKIGPAVAFLLLGPDLSKRIGVAAGRIPSRCA